MLGTFPDHLVNVEDSRSPLRMKPLLLTFSLAALVFASSANAAWQRLGGTDRRPVDIASKTARVASIASSKAVGQPENLITDDVTLSSKVGAGASEVVIAFSRQTVIDVVSIVNDGAEGSFSVEVSIDNQKWVPLKQVVFTAADQSLFSKFAGAQVKYLKLQLDLSKGGSLRALNVYGVDSDLDYKISEPTPAQPSTPVNVGGGIGGTRIIYINPSPVQGDEVASKYGRFEFPESPDRFRTVIYDFGTQRTLTEFGSVHSARPVRFSAYVFEKELPEKEDWRGRKSFDPTVFESMKPVATADDVRGVGYIKAKLQKSVRARYIALRWEPDFNPPAFGVFDTNVVASDVTSSYDQGQGGNEGGNGNGSGTGSDGSDSTAGPPPGVGAFGSFTNPFSIGTGGFGSAGLPDPDQSNEADASP